MKFTCGSCCCEGGGCPPPGYNCCCGGCSPSGYWYCAIRDWETGEPQMAVCPTVLLFHCAVPDANEYKKVGDGFDFE